jgi:hypothetical protein
MGDIIVVESLPIIQVIETPATGPVQVVEALIPGPPGGPGPIGQSIIPFVYDYHLNPSNGHQPYRFPFAATILGVSGCLGVAATGSPVVIDINVNGVTIFPVQTSRPSFAPGVTDLPEIVLNVPIVTSDRLTIDLDDVGSTLSGEDLTIFIRYEKS